MLSYTPDSSNATFTRLPVRCNNCIFSYLIQAWALRQHGIQHGILFVFALQECGRRIQRCLIFCSDCRFALATLPQISDDRHEPCSHNALFAGVLTFLRSIVSLRGVRTLNIINIMFTQGETCFSQ